MAVSGFLIAAICPLFSLNREAKPYVMQILTKN
jgi:hypothetical protein